MKTLLPCELSPQSPSLSFIRQFYVKQELCGLRRMETHDLHARGFIAMGCAPCTRAISLGEDFRAGRWWWEDEAAKECGLHVKA